MERIYVSRYWKYDYEGLPSLCQKDIEGNQPSIELTAPFK
jgi:hypothetical protein